MIELDKQWIIWRLIVKKIAVVCLEFMTNFEYREWFRNMNLDCASIFPF